MWDTEKWQWVLFSYECKIDSNAKKSVNRPVKERNNAGCIIIIVTFGDGHTKFPDILGTICSHPVRFEAQV